MQAAIRQVFLVVLEELRGPHEDPRAHAPSANALRGREARRNEEELPKELLEAPFLGDAAQRVALPGRHGCPLAPQNKTWVLATCAPST